MKRADTGLHEHIYHPEKNFAHILQNTLSVHREGILSFMPLRLKRRSSPSAPGHTLS